MAAAGPLPTLRPMSQRIPDGPRVLPLAPADLPAAQCLVAECGWNQVEADWAHFVEHGSVLQVPAPDGGVAATAATLPYPPRFGWISMVLVTAGQRRQGLASVLLARCVAQLQAQGLVPVLDATPAGREVYRRLGFLDGWGITRWRRKAAPPGALALAANVRPMREDDAQQVAALDAAAFGAQRPALLRALAQRSRGFACVAEQGGRIAGFLLGRDGRVATQLGPIVARDAADAEALCAHALAHTAGPLLVDAVDRHAGFAARLREAGFEVERGYTRMALGTAEAFGDAALLFAIAGPELG